MSILLIADFADNTELFWRELCFLEVYNEGR
jgi:hypothetical protein